MLIFSQMFLSTLYNSGYIDHILRVWRGTTSLGALISPPYARFFLRHSVALNGSFLFQSCKCTCNCGEAFNSALKPLRNHPKACPIGITRCPSWPIRDNRASDLRQRAKEITVQVLRPCTRPRWNEQTSIIHLLCFWCGEETRLRPGRF